MESDKRSKPHFQKKFLLSAKRRASKPLATSVINNDTTVTNKTLTQSHCLVKYRFTRIHHFLFILFHIYNFLAFDIQQNYAT